MIDFPLDALPPSPASVDPTLAEPIDPLALPERHLEELGVADEDEGRAPLMLDCVALERQGLWDTIDCCDLCHSYDQMTPDPLQHKHVTVHGCCQSHQALNHLKPPPNDFLARLFRT
jgi:hypothetical protein